MKDPKISVLPAVREDIPHILRCITELARYEDMLDQVEATEEKLAATLFDRQDARVLIARYEGVPAGFALYFYNYSTFLAKPGIYLEDLFVLPEYREKGLGKALLTTLAKTAVGEGCGRLEWACLDWNKPSIAFYCAMGAEPMDGWTVYRLTGDTLTAAAAMAEE